MKKGRSGFTKKQRVVAGRLLLVLILVVYAYTAVAFREYRTWTVITLVVLLVVLGLAAWRFQGVRQFLWSASKTSVGLMVESLTAAEQSREPVPESMKARVRARAGYKCQKCGLAESKVLEIHHVNEKKSDNRFANLTLLCANDHRKAHRGDYTPRELRSLNRVSQTRDDS